PCWRVEQFVVAQECARCSEFEMKTLPDCAPTGFIERINCPTSQREEFKSCRSAALESRRFWRFVGSALAVAAAAAALVVLRQRELDRRALEKVRKQIESI
ncbi:JTB protein, partial [Tachuris rubrigastra]|nr:JTB protein [Tachuris rubrigastra]